MVEIIGNVDKKVIYGLDFNPRMSLTKLARALRMNRNTLEYRIKRLFENGTIKNSFAIVNGYNLGYEYHKYFIKTKRTWKEPFLGKLLNEKHIVWFGKTDGYWDFAITIRSKNRTELVSILKKINSFFSIKEKSLLLINKVITFNEKWLTDSEEIKEITNEATGWCKIDEKDEALLEIMSLNSRKNLVNISNKLKLTPEAVAKRIKNLEKIKAILGYKLGINYSSLGYDYYHLLINLNDENLKEDIIIFLKHFKNCVTVLEFYGSYDVQAEFIAKNYKEIREMIENLKTKFSNEIEDVEKLFIIEESRIKTF